MWELLTVFHHPAKFGGHWHYGRGDVIILICHLILQYHLSEDHVTLSVEANHLKSPTLPCLLTIDLVPADI